MLSMIERAGVLRSAGMALQLANVARPWDHWPVQVTVRMRLHAKEQRWEQKRWNMDALNMMLMEGEGRAEVLEAIEGECKQRFRAIEVAAQQSRGPDEAWG
eukprot:8986394-Lingulodinium_polyedra.AAC.1